MNRRTVQVLIIAGAAATAGIVWFGRPAREEPLRASDALVERVTAPQQAQAPVTEQVEPLTEQQQLPAATDPRVQEYEERERFHNEVREFFARAPALSEEERTARAKDIARQITDYEAKGELAAAEALTLRSALVRETVADPVEQLVAIRSLQEHYQQQGERKQAEWLARSDPQFELYKAREREIVAEVMAMKTIPDGLTRDEYLRRRLQSAREQLVN